LRIIVQRVSQAEVSVAGECLGRIGPGLMALVGFTEGDGPKDLEYAADKLANLRVFPDVEGKMNLSVTDVGGAVLVVPNFTLYGDCRRGRRPSFTAAGDPTTSEGLFADLIALVRARGIQCAEGRFGAHMHVALVNDGPVTLMLDSRGAF
jgi:D-aminoacyl-tRNA deacylase